MRVAPGGTVGVLGGGQLGRMLALSAKTLGYRIVALDPSPESPCAQVADEAVVASFSDEAAALKMAESCDVVTYEFENVDVRVVEALEARGVTVRPGSKVLRVTQDRLAEKRFLRSVGVATADFHPVSGAEELERAARAVGFPAILKTVHGGYDGKGQAPVRDMATARAARAALKGPLIWEKRLVFAKEASVLAARGADGAFVCYGLAENAHEDGILDRSTAPAKVSAPVRRRAFEIARAVGKGLDLVGTFCVELFVMPDGRLLANEIAPRPHNSGHYTIDACVCSQFEQQLRAVCGLPLGPVALDGAAAMVNLLGTGEGDSLAGTEKALAHPGARLHLYGKDEAKAGRKMGHLTVLGESPERALKDALRLRKAMRWVPAA